MRSPFRQAIMPNISGGEPSRILASAPPGASQAYEAAMAREGKGLRFRVSHGAPQAQAQPRPSATKSTEWTPGARKLMLDKLTAEIERDMLLSARSEGEFINAKSAIMHARFDRHTRNLKATKKR